MKERQHVLNLRIGRLSNLPRVTHSTPADPNVLSAVYLYVVCYDLSFYLTVLHLSIFTSSKICFWLLENNHRVMIAACDTFRSGAVEQLRTHTRHLNSLHPPAYINGPSNVTLYDKGYGKDAAGVAMEAINLGEILT